jgi:hypothetical protein
LKGKIMLTESKVLKSVTVLPAVNAVEVLWVNQIKRGDEVVAEENFRTTYAPQQKEAFVAEVDGAQHYVTALGW